MADLSTIIQQYPILEALCLHLRIADFVTLTQLNLEFRLLLKGLNRPILPREKSVFPFKPCPKHGTPGLRNMLRTIDRTCESDLHTGFNPLAELTRSCNRPYVTLLAV
ncbi:hypothetical protein CFE70_008212 [Pyrenophora teres f. teres 0-1]